MPTSCSSHRRPTIDRDRLLAGIEVTVAVWEGRANAAAGGAVTALAHDGDAAEAAIALGARIAAVRRGTLTLIDDGSRRRLSGLVERLDRFGVHAEVTSPDTPGDGLVALEFDAPAPAGADGLLRVRPSRLTDQSELSALLEAGPIVLPAQQPTSAQTV